MSDAVRALYSIKFLYPAEYPLKVFYEDGVCDRAADSSIVKLMKSTTSSYRYRIQDKSSILLTATQNIPPGLYSFQIASENKLSVSSWGFGMNEFTLEMLSSREIPTYQREIVSTGILRVTYSSLYFSDSTPGSNATLSVIICFFFFMSKSIYINHYYYSSFTLN